VSERIELPTVEERCETCRFWLVDEEVKFRGECRRMPPALDVFHAISVVLNVRDKLREEHSHDENCCSPYLDEEGDDQFVKLGIHPLTINDSWCGEWQAKRTV
jgi:hypothetical protein